jgi:hypothetical protein
MNNWLNEYMAEQHRQDILKQSKEIRLGKTANNSRTQHLNLFERTMYNFANWMITTGKQIRKRYEIPAVTCNNPPTNSFAR